MSLKARVAGLGRRVIGQGGMKGHFDGLTGVDFTGWVAGVAGGAVTLMFGDEPLCQTFATIERPDLANAGVRGFGFAISTTVVDTELRKTSRSRLSSGVLQVVDNDGAPLLGSTEQVAKDHLLLLLAISTAIRTLGAPTQGTTHGVY